MEAEVVIPIWVKLVFTLFVLVTVVVYAVKYPLGNFLWFSDIALLSTVPALWFESSLLASMMAVGILLPEALWNVSFLCQLVTGKRLSGLTDYMFDPDKPLYLKALSLFHVFLPPLLVWTIAQLGYAPEAWIPQTVLAWVVLPLSFWLTTPEENVNWVYGFGARPQQRMPSLGYLLLLMIGFPVLVYLPTHLLLQALFA